MRRGETGKVRKTDCRWSGAGKPRPRWLGVHSSIWGTGTHPHPLEAGEHKQRRRSSSVCDRSQFLNRGGNSVQQRTGAYRANGQYLRVICSALQRIMRNAPPSLVLPTIQILVASVIRSPSTTFPPCVIFNLHASESCFGLVTSI